MIVFNTAPYHSQTGVPQIKKSEVTTTSTVTKVIKSPSYPKPIISVPKVSSKKGKKRTTTPILTQEAIKKLEFLKTGNGFKRKK